MRRFKQNTTVSSSNSGFAVSRREFVLGGSALSLGLLPLSFALTQKAVAATVFDYYISPSGSDSNPGTQTQPWAITALNTKRSLYAGKSVGLLDGTYYVAALAKGFADADRVVLDVASGTASSPTIIQAVNSQRAIIEGTDGSGNRVNAYYSRGCGIIGQSYLTSGDVGYVTLKDLVIRKGYRYLVHFRYNAGIANGPRYPGVVVENCDISDINSDGFGVGDNISCIQVYCTTGMIVRNCKIYNARGDRTANDSNGYGIQTWSCNGSVFEFNTITNCKDGIYVKNAYQTGCTIRNNYINLGEYDGAGATNAILGLGFSTAGTQHVTAYNNVLVAQNGWRVVGDLATGLQGPCQFYNNTVVAAGTDFLTAGIEMFGGSYAESFYNNIVYHSSKSASEEGDFACNVTNVGVVDYNCYPAVPKICTAPSGALYPTLSYITTSLMSVATGFDKHSIAANPLFVNSGGDAANYKLQSGSPARGVGRVGGVSTGAAVDIGAWSGSVTQIGCDFVRVMPMAPALQVS